jgi:ABC-2 type transport system ATP-binding protein
MDVETERDHDLRRDLARTIVSNGWGLLELRSMQMSLEDVFLHLTTEEQDEGSIILDESSQPEQLHHKKHAAELDNE